MYVAFVHRLLFLLLLQSLPVFMLPAMDVVLVVPVDSFFCCLHVAFISCGLFVVEFVTMCVPVLVSTF